MSTSFGAVPASSVLPVFFGSYGKTNGESITLSGLATSDIQIYKGGSVTQRSSTAGFTLIDTDGIDVDSITGIHGFTIDLSDNTDAGFYAVGSYYTVVVSTVTVDSQTLSFVAASFRIVASETSPGVSDVNVSTIASNAITASAIATDAIGSAELAATATAEIADAILDRDMSTGADSGSTTVRTVRQALRALRNKWVSSGGTLTVYKEDDVTSSWTSVVTGDASADPVVSSDPAGP